METPDSGCKAFSVEEEKRCRESWSVCWNVRISVRERWINRLWMAVSPRMRQPGGMVFYFLVIFFLSLLLLFFVVLVVVNFLAVYMY